ncbi:MAG: hypothetical protein WKF96_13760 [Solirubrobacteraceae bacterium]
MSAHEQHAAALANGQGGVPGAPGTLVRTASYRLDDALRAFQKAAAAHLLDHGPVEELEVKERVLEGARRDFARAEAAAVIAGERARNWRRSRPRS